MNKVELQRVLQRLGLYSGELDGKWGPLSQAAFDRLVEAARPRLLEEFTASAVKSHPTGWTWDQSEGALYRAGRLVARGYSGRKGPHRNNPASEGERAKGPIPRGRYSIGAPRTSAKTGPFVMDLTPIGHDALGRSAFQIHGDNRAGDASSGCIILPRAVRETIAASGLKEIEVVR